MEKNPSQFHDPFRPKQTILTTQRRLKILRCAQAILCRYFFFQSKAQSSFRHRALLLDPIYIRAFSPLSLFCTVVPALNLKNSFIDKYILHYFPTDILPIQWFINSQQTILHFYQPQRNLYVLVTNLLVPSSFLDLSSHWSAFFWICLLWTFHIYGTIFLMVFVASFFHIAYIFKLSDHYCTMCQHLVILNAARYSLVWTGHTIFMNSVVSKHFSSFHFFQL